MQINLHEYRKPNPVRQVIFVISTHYESENVISVYGFFQGHSWHLDIPCPVQLLHSEVLENFQIFRRYRRCLVPVIFRISFKIGSIPIIGYFGHYGRLVRRSTTKMLAASSMKSSPSCYSVKDILNKLSTDLQFTFSLIVNGIRERSLQQHIHIATFCQFYT